MGMVTRDYPLFIGTLFEGSVESVVSTFFHLKQYFEQMNQDWA